MFPPLLFIRQRAAVGRLRTREASVVKWRQVCINFFHVFRDSNALFAKTQPDRTQLSDLNQHCLISANVANLLLLFTEGTFLAALMLNLEQRSVCIR